MVVCGGCVTPEDEAVERIIMNKRVVIILIKVGVSFALLSYLISRLDYQRLWGVVHNAVPLWLILSMLILIARNWVGAWRCRVLLRAKGLDFPMSHAVQLYFTSQFFNIFLPTSIGGDVARGYYLGKEIGHWADVAAVVVMERLLGFIALIILVLISVPFCLMVVGSAMIFYVALGLCLVMLLIIVVLFSPLMKGISFLHRIKALDRRVQQLRSLLNSLHSFKDRSRLVFASILSLIFQLVAVYTTYLLALGIGEAIPLLYFLLILPLVQIVSMFPFTLSGLGVREGAFVYLFALVGVDSHIGLSIGLLFFAQLLILSIIGEQSISSSVSLRNPL